MTKKKIRMTGRIGCNINKVEYKYCLVVCPFVCPLCCNINKVEYKLVLLLYFSGISYVVI